MAGKNTAQIIEGRARGYFLWLKNGEERILGRHFEAEDEVPSDLVGKVNSFPISGRYSGIAKGDILSYNHAEYVVNEPTPFEKSKKQKTFDVADYNFEEVVNSTINNKTDDELYEREIIEGTILSHVKPQEGSQKPNFITLLSGRGSGKASLLRRIALHSNSLSEERNCGRIMIVEGSIFFEALRHSEKPLSKNMREVIPVLVALHLCKVFGDSSVDGVEYSSIATFDVMWERKGNLPQTLLSKLDTINDAEQAYTWWRESTKILGGHQGVKPVILMDTAEQLSVESETMKHGDGKGKSYLLIEEISIKIPIDHSFVAFGTGATNKRRPVDYGSKVNPHPIPPLGALSLDSAKKLLAKFNERRKRKIEDREFKTIYTATAGVPRMLVVAFTADKQLTTSSYSDWEDRMHDFYSETYTFLADDEVGVPYLAKAIVTCSVKDVPSDSSHLPIPSEQATWDDLRWRSILFAASKMQGPNDEPDTKTYWQIPRFLWRGNPSVRSILQKYVADNCHFSLDDLVPTVMELIVEGGASAQASGKPWEKLFASAVVARYFTHCWENQEQNQDDPYTRFVSLRELLPQRNVQDNATLETIEVCLGKGIIVAAEERTCKDGNLFFEDDWKAIHANWGISGAHHDLILPVRRKGSGQQELWGISAKSGNRKPQSKIINDTKQHLKSKEKEDEENYVAGLIQAVNPRSYEMGDRRLSGRLKGMEQQKQYAEVTLWEGQARFILWCFE